MYIICLGGGQWQWQWPVCILFLFLHIDIVTVLVLILLGIFKCGSVFLRLQGGPREKAFHAVHVKPGPPDSL